MNIKKHGYPVCKTNTKKCPNMIDILGQNSCYACKVNVILIEINDNEKYFVPRPNCPLWNADDVYNIYKEHYPYGYIVKDGVAYDTDYIEEERTIKRHNVFLEKHKKPAGDFMRLNEAIIAHGNRLKMLVKNGKIDLDGFDNDILSGVKAIIKAENNNIMVEYYAVILIEETDDEVIERLKHGGSYCGG